MKPIFRRGVKFLGITIACFLILGMLLSLATNLMDSPSTKTKMTEKFEPTGFQPKSHFLDTPDGQLHYVTVGDSNNPTLFLIHGSPGSWEAWIDFLTETATLDRYFVVVIDRIPYHKTSIRGRYSLQEQSALLAPLMKIYGEDAMVAGHSYGGALALQLGVDYPEHIIGVVSIAGTLAAPYQNPRWYNYVVRFTPLRWLIFRNLAASNREMWHLKKGLLNLEEQLPTFDKKIALVQGGKDMIVNPKSPTYVKQFLHKAKVKVFFKEKLNHFVIWRDKAIVMEALEWLSADGKE